MGNSNPNAGTDVIKVKVGQGAIKYYTVVPKKPVNGVAQDWEVTAVDGTPQGLVGDYDIRFKNESSPLQSHVEKAILVFVIENAVEGEFWQFANGGIQINGQTGDLATKFNPQVLDNGAVLQIEISRTAVGQDEISTRFVGSCTDMDSGEIAFFTSSDPIMRGRRY